jgi:hypothetical protein
MIIFQDAILRVSEKSILFRASIILILKLWRLSNNIDTITEQHFSALTLLKSV